MKLDRLGDITSELSTSLVKSIVLPGSLLEWLTTPLKERIRDRLKPGNGTKAGDLPDVGRANIALGPIVMMGGVPVPDEAIVAMIHLAGGRSARLAVMPVATQEHQSVAENGLRLFARFGMKKAQALDLITREQAESPEYAERLASYDAFFLCGEDAGIGLHVLKETLCGRALRALHTAGKPVAGLGGGATMLAERLFVDRGGEEQLVEGLALAPGLLVETSFGQNLRFASLVGGLQQARAYDLLGVGLDEGAAFAIREGEARVLGERSVTFVDPRESLAGGEMAEGQAAGMKVHLLQENFGLSLRSRRPLSPPKEPAKAAGEI